MFGDLARHSATKQKALIATNVRAAVFTYAREPGLWSSCQTVRGAPTNDLLVFANGQMIRSTEVVISRFPMAEATDA